MEILHVGTRHCQNCNHARLRENRFRAMEKLEKWETDFIHLQCWEVLRILIFQHQRCIKLSNIRMTLDDDNDKRGVKRKSKEESEMRTGRIK